MPLSFSHYLPEETKSSSDHIPFGRKSRHTQWTHGWAPLAKQEGSRRTLTSHGENRPWYVSAGRNHNVFVEWITESVNSRIKWLLLPFYGHEDKLILEKNILESGRKCECGKGMEKQQFYQRKPAWNTLWTLFRIIMNYWLQIIHNPFLVVFRWN